jgi:choice-of-anchor B domain-containing protein
MQIVDLTQLRTNCVNKNNLLTINYVYRDFGSCHNIVINEGSGFAYAVGTRTCSGGLHIVNIQDPSNAYFEGCFSLDGYTHDAECINYNGPDSDWNGHEVCFGYNEDSLTVVDVSDHSNPTMISRTGYTGSAYTHQGWISSNHDYIFLDDELDEVYGVVPGGYTRTWVWNVQNLDNPIAMGYISSVAVSIDHNLYITSDDLAFLTNYQAGLRIYDLDAIVNSNPLELHEVGYFDVYPEADSLSFLGAWSNFPYFKDESGALNNIIIVQSIDRGLFVLRFNEDADPSTHTPLTYTSLI